MMTYSPTLILAHLICAPPLQVHLSRRVFAKLTVGDQLPASPQHPHGGTLLMHCVLQRCTRVALYELFRCRMMASSFTVS